MEWMLEKICNRGNKKAKKGERFVGKYLKQKYLDLDLEIIYLDYTKQHFKKNFEGWRRKYYFPIVNT